MRLAAEEARAVFAELRQGIAVARAELEAASREPLFTEEEKRQLQEVANSGAMGSRMEEFAEDVRRGEADWESFIRRQDGRDELLEGFMEKAQDEFADDAQAAMDAAQFPDDVEDPRPGR